ncbi:hypothetical protein S1OALGB6SA_1452 [Olavius algarvensis spirochete endosymbiont]|nr:MAG: hypothetical protein [Olavius algarvensis spirochete endosymbiont]VDB00374.1 hypothetical protein S1OALGB6SA_1452 [Olavius algarvensis spirochete endosymbiont]
MQIPLCFRRLLNRRRYRTAFKILLDRVELSLLKSVFSPGEEYHYQNSFVDRKTAEFAATFMKKSL